MSTAKGCLHAERFNCCIENFVKSLELLMNCIGRNNLAEEFRALIRKPASLKEIRLNTFTLGTYLVMFLPCNALLIKHDSRLQVTLLGSFGCST